MAAPVKAIEALSLTNSEVEMADFFWSKFFKPSSAGVSSCLGKETSFEWYVLSCVVPKSRSRRSWTVAKDKSDIPRILAASISWKKKFVNV